MGLGWSYRERHPRPVAVFALAGFVRDACVDVADVAWGGRLTGPRKRRVDERFERGGEFRHGLGLCLSLCSDAGCVFYELLALFFFCFSCFEILLPVLRRRG